MADFFSRLIYFVLLFCATLAYLIFSGVSPPTTMELLLKLVPAGWIAFLLMLASGVVGHGLRENLLTVGLVIGMIFFVSFVISATGLTGMLAVTNKTLYIENITNFINSTVHHNLSTPP